MLSSKTNTLSKRVQQRSVFKLVTLMIFSLCFVWKSAWAKYSLIQYRPLTYQEAKSLLLKKGTIPLELNEAVLKWLNYFLSDPKGRMYTLNSLERMRSYESFIKEKLKSEGMPFELLGVPFIESGFVGERTSPAGARGLWSFMPQTARKYGLKVDLKNGFDERLSVDKLTYAAIHYYKDLLTYKSFRGDWRFALLAYNVGENRLARAIEERGSSNPWDYSDLGDKEYLAKIFAGMIIVQNSSHSHFGSPLKNLKVTSSFGFRDNPLDKESHSRDFHEGLDLKAHEGDSVFSPMAGEVKQIKQVKGAGSFVVIDHGDGVETRFRHIGNLLIKKGDTVEKKQVIGEVAQTELSTGAHLRVEVLLNGRHVDPEPFF